MIYPFYEGNVPRTAKTRDAIKSYHKPFNTWSMDELGVADDEDLPNPEESITCEFVDGDSLDEKVGVFAHKISDLMSAME